MYMRIRHFYFVNHTTYWYPVISSQSDTPCVYHVLFVYCIICILSIYRIYSRISRKIYDKIMPQKLGGDLSAGHKIKKFFPGAKIRNFQCSGNQSVFRVVYRVSRNLRQNWALGSRPTRTINRRLASWAAKRIIAHEALCRCLRWVPGYNAASMDIWPPPSVRPAALPLPRLTPRFLLLYSGPVEMAC